VALGFAPFAAETSGFLEGIVIFESTMDFFESLNGVDLDGALGLQSSDLVFDGSKTFFDFSGAHGLACLYRDCIGFQGGVKAERRDLCKMTFGAPRERSRTGRSSRN